MKTIQKFRYLPVRGITLWPFIILKYEKDIDNKEVINHEKIHLKQQAELLVIPFFVLYILEFFIKMLYKGSTRAYKAISFENEAYSNADNLEYLKTRKSYSFLKYFK